VRTPAPYKHAPHMRASVRTARGVARHRAREQGRRGTKRRHVFTTSRPSLSIHLTVRTPRPCLSPSLFSPVAEVITLHLVPRRKKKKKVCRGGRTARWLSLFCTATPGSASVLPLYSLSHATRSLPSCTRPPQAVQWAEDTVDNEFLGRKSSKRELEKRRIECVRSPGALHALLSSLSHSLLLHFQNAASSTRPAPLASGRTMRMAGTAGARTAGRTEDRRRRHPRRPVRPLDESERGMGEGARVHFRRAPQAPTSARRKTLTTQRKGESLERVRRGRVDENKTNPLLLHHFTPLPIPPPPPARAARRPGGDTWPAPARPG